MATREQIGDTLTQVDALPVIWPRPRSLALATLGRLSVTAAAVFVVGVAAWLVPSPAGVGTHSQLRMPPCAFHQVTGLPCPSCGMTTAFACMARLDVLHALDAQPFGAALFLLVAASGAASLYCALFNKSLLAIASRVFTRHTGILLLLVFLLVWCFQIFKTLAIR